MLEMVKSNALGAAVVVALLCAPLAVVMQAFTSCAPEPAPNEPAPPAPPADEVVAPTGVGAGWPLTVDVTVGTTPVRLGPPQTGGQWPLSISVYNPTSNACYAGNENIDAGVGASYCASGCDRSVPMGGNYRELYVDCASSSELEVRFMLPARSTE